MRNNLPLQITESKTRLAIHRTTIGLLLLAFTSSSVPCFGGENSCPDMSSHERVLQQGMQMLAPGSTPASSGGGGGSGFFGWDNVPWESISIKRRSAKTVTDATDPGLWSVSPNSAASLPLHTLEDISVALTCAEHYTERNEFRSAQALYSRILTECPKAENIDGIIRPARVGLELAKLLADQSECSTSHVQVNSNQNIFSASTVISALRLANQNSSFGVTKGWLMTYLVSVIRKTPDPQWTLEKVLVDLVSAKDLDLSVKSQFVQYVLNDRSLLQVLREQIRKDSKQAGAQNPDLLAHAKTLAHNYKMALECLQMANDLDQTAFKLEKQQKYDMAMKLLNDSLEIKTKNLGPMNTDTIQQYGDIARVYASEHRYKQAEETYEQALALFRKLQGPREGYVTMLENYGDMLNRTNQKQKATKILNEAGRCSQSVTKD
jgi:tetratricopeptide (TPR) repeat protein